MNPFKSKKGLGRGLSSLIGDVKNTSTENKLSINFRDAFVPRRGRINCSLNDNGKWRWFGTQFIIR